MKKILVVSMVLLLIAINLVVIADKNGESNLSLSSLVNVAMANSEDGGDDNDCNECQYMQKNPFCVKFTACYDSAGNKIGAGFCTGYRTKCVSGTGTCTATGCECNPC